MKLAYKVFEPVNGSNTLLPPLIFLHGLALSKEYWGNIPQIIANNTGRKAYAPDARNHGESDWCEEFSDQLLMEDLLSFMDDIKAPKAVLIGHSVGGFIACKAALAAPERVEMLFVEDMLARKLDQEMFNHMVLVLKTLKQVEPLILQGMDKEEVENFITAHVFQSMHPQVPLDQIFQDKPDIFYPLCKDSTGRYRFATNLDVVIKKIQDVDSIMKESNDIYNGATYFLYGTKSFLHVDKDEGHIRKRFPRAVLIAFEGAKHEIHRQFPEKFSATVIEWIQLNQLLPKL
ncbi:hypothetical protein TNCT_472291 [Trichonephila clavata]|uniref:sn-1-specific diacylglycerol lipase ABHD11 n=1 Tax=Trichonephila clavata TaxID=2740835 RepID=A0A8X6H6N6_TRICU|nr:hypothetical protein TNCT_472291 [Trichonephila clavata]